jgi:hypothetical protein
VEPLPRRPVLKAALRRVWRDGTTLQLGVDEDRAVVLSGLDAVAGRFVAALDGTRETAEVLAGCGSLGLDEAAAARLLHLLNEAHALDDAAADTSALRSLGRDDRDRLAPDLASLSLAARLPGGGLAALSRRRAAAVAVHGAGRVGAIAATLLAAAGVGHLLIEDPLRLSAADLAPGGPDQRDVGRRRDDAAAAAARRCGPAALNVLPPGRHQPDLALLTPGQALDGRLVESLVRAGVPHQLASVHETAGTVGPLVLPGRSSCLRCLDLHRSDRDPGWPQVAAHLAASPPPGVIGCDVVLATSVAAHAVLQVLAYLDGETPATVDGTLELRLPDGLVRRRSWTPHPACGCRWALDAAG